MKPLLKSIIFFKTAREMPKFEQLFKISAFACKNTEYTNELSTLIIESRLKNECFTKETLASLNKQIEKCEDVTWINNLPLREKITYSN